MPVPIATNQIDAQPIVDQLRSWGLSADPLSWAPVPYIGIVQLTRGVNVGQYGMADLQPPLDALFADALPAVTADQVALAHVPTGTFTVTDGADVMSKRFDLDDADLALPDWCVRWDFGDGSFSRDPAGVDHTYWRRGTYMVGLAITVAGVRFASEQAVEVDLAPLYIDHVEPASVPVGPPVDVTVHVTGGGFTPDSRIEFAGNVEHNTKFVSAGQLTLEITAGLFPGADAAVPIRVLDGDRASAPVNFAFEEPS